MGKHVKGYVVPEEIPECCAECPFRSQSEEIPVGRGVYKKICRCLLAPEEIEDPWRDLEWTCDHKEEWCPLKTVEEYLQSKGEKAMKVRINTHGNPVPEKAEGGDWYDLRTSEDVSLKEGELKIIPLGISIEIPKGYTAYILPRSSTPKKFGIQMVNSMGVIDQSYGGDNDILGFVAKALRDTTIEKGTRVAQLAIYKSPETLEFESVERLGNADRGGFGSTGIK